MQIFLDLGSHACRASDFQLSRGPFFQDLGGAVNLDDCKKMFEIVCSRSATNIGRMEQMGFRRLLSAFTMMFALTATAPAQTPGAQSGAQPAPAPPALTMTTTAFADGTEIPAKYTQAGNQTSPAISWTNVPAATVTFLLHMHDLE